MPGITGIIGKGASFVEQPAFHIMTQCMMHENFYTSGTYENLELGLRVGWVVQQNSFSDCLPIWNEKKDICLIFVGEDAFDQSTVFDLIEKGHVFEPNNASYLVHLYEEYGNEFIKLLNGVFCGILIDLRISTAMLFNDRYGLNRVYYHINDDNFYFSSQAKSLLKTIPGLRSFDYSGLGELFAGGCTLENKTIFSNIHILPAGAAWKFKPNRNIEKEVFFSKASWENQPLLSQNNYFDKLKSTLSRTIKRYFHDGERVAVSLTGGIDTRMIMACASFPPLKIPCYTFAGMYRDSFDVKIARKVANICQQRHSTIDVNRKFFAEFPALAKRAVYYTDGTMDVSGAVELFVNKRAREIATIRITGNYGDQILRRVIGFKPYFLDTRIFDLDFLPFVKIATKSVEDLNKEANLPFFLHKQLPWHHYPRLALEQTQIIMRSPFLDNDLVGLAYQAPTSCERALDLSMRLIKDGNPLLTKFSTDRAVSFHAIPIYSSLKHFFRELSFKAEYAYDYGMPQWLSYFNHHFSFLHVENSFLGRHKFYHFRPWYRDGLSKYVKDILLDSRTLQRSYLNGKYIEHVVAEHTKGRKNFTNEIQMLLTSEIIQRHLLEARL
jgi:asparagine synthase (glutamine-hydrolysing)